MRQTKPFISGPHSPIGTVGRAWTGGSSEWRVPGLMEREREGLDAWRGVMCAKIGKGEVKRTQVSVHPSARPNSPPVPSPVCSHGKCDISIEM